MLSPVLITRLGLAPADPVERIAWLENKARVMRAKGLAAHWNYDHAIHTAVLTVLAAERVALAVTQECSSASPDRQHARAA
jgi:hypothetical protein